MKRSMMMVPLFFACLAVGCKKEPPPEPEKPKEAAKPEAKRERPEPPRVRLPSLSPDEPATKVEGAPTPTDFEAEADRTVRFENLEAELDRLEAEIIGG